jgi:catechol 2,3-dioxygenase-like lactoylglutathione lyase family enzyme
MMDTDLAVRQVDDFVAGRISRRQLASRLLGLGAALATFERSAIGQEAGSAVSAGTRPTFQATGLDHIALDVTDLPRSREFYQRHLGLRVIRGDDRASFLGADRDFFLTLFQADEAKMNHYCYAIENYDAATAVERLTAAGLEPRRTGNRVYFPDPDGLTVQVAGR